MPTPREYRKRDGTTTWRVRFRHAGRETSETFASRAAADTFCLDLDAHGPDHAVKMRDIGTAEAKTVDEAFAQWLAWKETRVRSDRTIADYRRRWDAHMSPTLGRIPLPALTSGVVQAWIDDLHDGRVGARLVVVGKERTYRPLSPKTIADRHALLHAVVKYAAASSRGWLSGDPCDSTDLPRRPKNHAKGLRPAEWQALTRALRQINPDSADLAEFLLATGWRWGEATALSKWDVEDDGRSVWVTVTQVMRRDATGRAKIVPDAKSEAGMSRRVKLGTAAAEMVRRRVAACEPGGLVFTTNTGAAFHYSHFRNRSWNPAVKAANLARKPTPHWLRHTHVAWMVAAGAKLPELQARIGHASIKTTIDVYGSLVNDVSDSALGGFDAISAGAASSIGPAISAVGAR